MPSTATVPSRATCTAIPACWIWSGCFSCCACSPPSTAWRPAIPPPPPPWRIFCSPPPEGDLAERAAADLGRWSDVHGGYSEVFGDAEALRGDLSWLEANGFTRLDWDSHRPIDPGPWTEPRAGGVHGGVPALTGLRDGCHRHGPGVDPRPTGGWHPHRATSRTPLPAPAAGPGGGEAIRRVNGPPELVVRTSQGPAESLSSEAG
jgi:hypothetical protein